MNQDQRNLVTPGAGEKNDTNCADTSTTLVPSSENDLSLELKMESVNDYVEDFIGEIDDNND